MNGKDYVELLRYKDYKSSQKWKSIKSWVDKNKKFILLFEFIFILGIALIIAVVNYTSPEPSKFNYTWEGIGMFLAIMAGIGWALMILGIYYNW